MIIKKKIKMLIAYDGTPFMGWQRQSPGKPSVQAEIELALSRFFSEKIVIWGAGRTDAGVHAVGQVAHFFAPKEFEAWRLLHAINRLTHPAISIRKLWDVPEEFHSLASAERKIYRYTIWNAPYPHPFRRQLSYHVPYPLDFEKLRGGAQFFVGEKNFASMQNTGSEVRSTVREIYSCEWKKRGHWIEMRVEGSGFLKQMVRNIVGLQLELLKRGKPMNAIEEILFAKDRRRAALTAPPQGLFLQKVIYPAELDKECREL